MKFDKTPPTWNAEGTEPPSSLKNSGFSAGYKPPAAYFNWFWNKVCACLAELQTKLTGVITEPVTATSTDGVAYTATVDGITELYNGLKITIIPDTNSTSTACTLNVNGLGAKKVRMTLPFSSGNSGTLATVEGWMSANAPITLTYHSKFETWKTDLTRQSAQALYGKVPIQGGGTWADSNTTEEDKAKARQDLGIETVNGTTTSGNADYAEVGQWADGNTSDEDRIGYFVAVDPSTAGTTMVKATSTMDVRGVTVAAPAFSGNCSADKFDSDGNLLKQYDFVAVMGLVSVIDNGTCTINGRCMPADDGTAIPSTNNMGYQVIDRIDSTHIMIAVEPGADMAQRIKTDMDGKQDALSGAEGQLVGFDADGKPVAQDAPASGLEMILLWKNASPGSEFSGQSIVVNNMSTYRFICVKFLSDTNGSEIIWSGIADTIGSGMETTFMHSMRHRVFKLFPSYNMINFFGCNYSTDLTAVNNGNMIPLEVYGISGIKL